MAPLESSDRRSRRPSDDSDDHRRRAHKASPPPHRRSSHANRRSASPRQARRSLSDDDRPRRKRPRGNSRSPERSSVKRGRDSPGHERHRRDRSVEGKPRVPAGARFGSNYRRSRDPRERERERERERSRDRKTTRPRSRSRDRRSRGAPASPSPARSTRRRSTSRDRHRRHRSRSRSRDRESQRHPRTHPRSHPRSHSPSPQRSPIRRTAPLPSQNAAFVAEQDPDAPPPVDKQKPNFNNTGLLAKEANRVAGTTVSLKYHEPPEARKPPPSIPWSLVVFKDSACLSTTDLSTRSCWLVGREAKVADILVEHPSCSGQHAAIQFRYREKETRDGKKKGRVRPYVIDLESRNGTFVDGERVEGGRYVELRSGDVVRFGESAREYVLMNESG